MAAPLEILVVAPHPGMRASLCDVLGSGGGIHVAAGVPDMPAALRPSTGIRARVAVVDDRAVVLGSGPAAEAIAALARRMPVVVIGMGDPAAYTRPYAAAGASGYWCKTGDVEELAALLHDVA